MIKILPNQTYVAIPSHVPESEFNSIAGYFRQLPDLQVVYGRELPESRYVGMKGPEVVEFSKWVVNLSPEALRQLTLLTYEKSNGNGMMNASTFPLGRDLWNGVKYLGGLIHKNFRDGHDKLGPVRPVMELKSHGKSNDGGPYIDLSISICLPSEELMLEDLYYELRHVFFPLIGFLSSTSPGEVLLSIGPERRSNWPWSVWNHDTNVMYGVDPRKRLFIQLSNDSVKKNEPIKQCLMSLGLTEYSDKPSHRRLAGHLN